MRKFDTADHMNVCAKNVAAVAHIFIERSIYRKIPNISPGLIEVRKHFLGGLYSEEWPIFGGHFVLSVRVSRP